MRPAKTGALATAITLVLTATVSAQSGTTYYQPTQNTYATGTSQPTLGSVLGSTTTATGTYGAATGVPSYTTTTPYAPQPVGQAYVTSAPQTPLAQPAAPLTTTAQTTYASPYVPTAPVTYGATTGATISGGTYVAPEYGTASTTYTGTAPATTTAPIQTFGGTVTAYQPVQSPLFPQAAAQTVYGAPIQSQPLPAPAGYVPAVPASTVSSDAIEDTDSWTYNLARFYPAIQACLRRSTAKNPVIANIQEQGDKTRMLIGEGGSSDYSTCSTGLTGTTVKANSGVRTTPPAFFAPLGSTFTLSPERPFQPIVDTDQKVIGWMVRTRPSAAFDQFGQAAPGFDGQFIPPVMVNTSVGRS